MSVQERAAIEGIVGWSTRRRSARGDVRNARAECARVAFVVTEISSIVRRLPDTSSRVCRKYGSSVGARGMAEEELIVKAPPEAVKKGGYCIIRGNPCRLDVCEVLPKATANGNKRLHLKGPHVFTGKSYEDTLNLTAGFHGIDVPVTVKAQYSLLDADSDTGFLSLLTDSGDCKEDVGLARGEDGAFDQLGKEVIRRLEAGEALRLTVLSLMGKDVVIACDADAEA